MTTQDSYAVAQAPYPPSFFLPFSLPLSLSFPLWERRGRGREREGEGGEGGREGRRGREKEGGRGREREGEGGEGGRGREEGGEAGREDRREGKREGTRAPLYGTIGYSYTISLCVFQV